MRFRLGLAIAATLLSSLPAVAGQISGKQYVVLRRGAEVIPDNEVLYAPCGPINKQCVQVRRKAVAMLKDATDRAEATEVSSSPYLPLQSEVHHMCTYSDAIACSVTQDIQRALMTVQTVTSLEVLKSWMETIDKTLALTRVLKNRKVVRTDFDGNFSFNCPTKYCLVYSVGEVGATVSQWVEILPSGKRTDLSGSNAFTVNKR